MCTEYPRDFWQRHAAMATGPGYRPKATATQCGSASTLLFYTQHNSFSLSPHLPPPPPHTHTQHEWLPTQVRFVPPAREGARAFLTPAANSTVSPSASLKHGAACQQSVSRPGRLHSPGHCSRVLCLASQRAAGTRTMRDDDQSFFCICSTMNAGTGLDLGHV